MFDHPVARAVKRMADNVLFSFRRLFRPFNIRKAFPVIDNPRPILIGAAIMLAVMLIGMTLIDAGLTRAAKRLPVWLIDLFNFLTDFGKSAWFLWPLGLLYLFLAAMPPILPRISRAVLAAIMVRVGFLFTAIGLPSLFASLIKNMIGRARPGVPGTIDPFVFDPFHWAPAFASLPSGHTTTAFAALAAIGTLWPRLRTALLIYAVIIAASRIVVQAHFFTDTLAAAATGIVGVILVRRWFAAVRLGFSLTPSGGVRAFPGPSVARIKAVARGLLA